jgi:hypothetical protein
MSQVKVLWRWHDLNDTKYRMAIPCMPHGLLKEGIELFLFGWSVCRASWSGGVT